MVSSFKKKNIFEGVVNIHAQFATQASIISFLLKKYNNEICYYFTFHAYDIYFDNKWFSPLLENSESAFSISDFNINYVQKHYQDIDHNKLVLSRLGVNKPLNSFVNRKNNKDFTIGFLSWLEDKKGLGYLLEAMKGLINHSEIKLLIAGDGHGKEKMKTFIRENNLSENCKYLGAVRDAKKNNFFRSIDAFILPSIQLDNDQDGIPVVLMEAISYGLPLISTNISGIPEICVHNYNGLLIEERNVKQIKEAILFLSENEEKRKGFGKNSLSVFNEYNIDVNSKKKVEVMSWANLSKN